MRTAHFPARLTRTPRPWPPTTAVAAAAAIRGILWSARRRRLDVPPLSLPPPSRVGPTAKLYRSALGSTAIISPAATGRHILRRGRRRVLRCGHSALRGRARRWDASKCTAVDPTRMRGGGGGWPFDGGGGGCSSGFSCGGHCDADGGGGSGCVVAALRGIGAPARDVFTLSEQGQLPCRAREADIASARYASGGPRVETTACGGTCSAAVSVGRPPLSWSPGGVVPREERPKRQTLDGLHGLAIWGPCPGGRPIRHCYERHAPGFEGACTTGPVKRGVAAFAFLACCLGYSSAAADHRGKRPSVATSASREPRGALIHA